jgi:hypothetical protein
MSKQIDSVVLTAIYVMTDDDYSAHVAKLTNGNYFVVISLGDNLIMSDLYTSKEDVVVLADNYTFNVMGLEDWLGLT